MKPAFCVLVVCKYAAGSGPVYVNPEVAQSSSAPPSSGGDLVTQTVYGFLDFTTTIGNTVMIFSPQSAPAAPGKALPDLSAFFLSQYAHAWSHALKRTRNDFLSFHFALCSSERALWKYSRALKFSRSLFFLIFFSFLKKYIISFYYLHVHIPTLSGRDARCLFITKCHLAASCIFKWTMGQKGSQPLLLKKEEIHSDYAAMQEKLCEAPKAIQSAHTMGEIILSLELHSTYVHSRFFKCIHISLCLLFYCFYSLSLSLSGSLDKETLK